MEQDFNENELISRVVTLTFTTQERTLIDIAYNNWLVENPDQSKDSFYRQAILEKVGVLQIGN